MGSVVVAATLRVKRPRARTNNFKLYIINNLDYKNILDVYIHKGLN